LGAQLWEDYQAFAQRDLSEYEIAYLFVDGIAERLRAGAKREPVCVFRARKASVSRHVGPRFHTRLVQCS